MYICIYIRLVNRFITFVDAGRKCGTSGPAITKFLTVGSESMNTVLSDISLHPDSHRLIRGGSEACVCTRYRGGPWLAEPAQPSISSKCALPFFSWKGTFSKVTCFYKQWVLQAMNVSHNSEVKRPRVSSLSLNYTYTLFCI